MKIMWTEAIRWLVFAVVAVAAGCGSNIQHIESPEAPVPRVKRFDASVDRVWPAAQQALVEDETVKVLDRSSGVIVTEFRAIDAKELSLAQTYFLGKTYKSSYTVNLMPAGAGGTEVRVNVKLQAVQLALLAREEANEVVEGYLRKRLFERIDANLARSGGMAPTAPAVAQPASAPTPPQEADRGKQADAEQRIPPAMRQSPPVALTKEVVVKAQRRLKELGFDPGSADGSLGPRSVAAIRRFQAARKLPITGQLTDDTLQALGVAAQ